MPGHVTCVALQLLPLGVTRAGVYLSIRGMSYPLHGTWSILKHTVHRVYLGIPWYTYVYAMYRIPKYTRCSVYLSTLHHM